MAGRAEDRFGAVHPGIHILNKAERPRHIGRMAIYLMVEQIAQPHEGAAHGHGNHHPVERPQVGHPIVSGEEPQANQQAHRSAMAGHAAVPESQDLDRIGQIVARFVEQTVTQPRADDRGQGAVDENGIGQLGGQPLALAEPREKIGAQADGHRPHHAVPADIEGSDADKRRVELPDDRKE